MQDWCFKYKNQYWIKLGFLSNIVNQVMIVLPNILIELRNSISKLDYENVEFRFFGFHETVHGKNKYMQKFSWRMYLSNSEKQLHLALVVKNQVKLTLWKCLLVNDKIIMKLSFCSPTVSQESKPSVSCDLQKVILIYKFLLFSHRDHSTNVDLFIMTKGNQVKFHAYCRYKEFFYCLKKPKH